MTLLRVLLVLLLSFSFANAEEPDKWEGYLEFTGKPGTTRSLGVSDLFVPLVQDENDMTFLNVRGHLSFDDDSKEINIGFGHRHMFSDFILGAYTYYDRSKSDLDFSYEQWTTGMEVLGEKWDVRLNGYVSDKKGNQWEIENNDVKAKISGNQIWVDYSQSTFTSKEQAMSGVDGEIGYKLPFLEDLRIYAGGYHFFGEDGINSISGPRVRMEMRLHDIDVMGNGSRLMLGLESQHDKTRGTQTSGLLSIRIPFGLESDKKIKRLEGLDRRMMEPVVRDIDIVTGANQTVETISERTAALNPEDLAYTTVMNHASDESLFDIVTAVMDEIENEKALPLVIIEASENNDNLSIDDTQLVGRATYAMAGKELEVGYHNRFTGEILKTSFTPEGKTPNQEYVASRKLKALYIGDRVHINGFDIDAAEYNHGLLFDEGGTYYVTNTTIKNARLGVVVDGDGSINVLHIKDSVITGRADGKQLSDQSFGFGSRGLAALDGGQIYADNVFVTESDGNGVVADGDGSFISIINSTISKNDYDGLKAINDGAIFASNVIIEDNLRFGLVSGIGSLDYSYVYIEDSIVRRNGLAIGVRQFDSKNPVTKPNQGIATVGAGIFVDSGGTLDGYRLRISENHGNAIQAWGNAPATAILYPTTVNIFDSVIEHDWIGIDWIEDNGAALSVNDLGTTVNIENTFFKGSSKIAVVANEGSLNINNSVFSENFEFVINTGGSLTGSDNVDGNGNNLFFP